MAKFDPNEVKYIFMRAVGGEVGAASALAPKVGPMGLVSQDTPRESRGTDGRLTALLLPPEQTGPCLET